MIIQTALNLVGFLNHHFAELYFGDDEDYCRRIREVGYNLALSFRTYIKHDSGCSSLRIPDENNRRLKSAEVIARLKFGDNNKIRNQNTGFFGVNKIWLINLERRKDRLERFKKNNPILADRVELLKACDGQDLELTPKTARLFASNTFQWNKAKMGCCLSHLQIWQNLIKETDNDTTYLILEDDAVLLDNWYQCLMDAFYDNKIPIDWDIVYLGGTGSNGEDPLWHTIVPSLLDHLQGGIHQMKPNSFYGQNPPNRFLHFTTIAYLINKKGAIRTLDLINRGNGFWTAVDHVLAHRMQETDEVDRKIYFFYPHIASYYQVETSGFAKKFILKKIRTAFWIVIFGKIMIHLKKVMLRM